MFAGKCKGRKFWCMGILRIQLFKEIILKIICKKEEPFGSRSLLGSLTLLNAPLFHVLPQLSHLWLIFLSNF